MQPNEFHMFIMIVICITYGLWELDYDIKHNENRHYKPIFKYLTEKDYTETNLWRHLGEKPEISNESLMKWVSAPDNMIFKDTMTRLKSFDYHLQPASRIEDVMGNSLAVDHLKDRFLNLRLVDNVDATYLDSMMSQADVLINIYRILEHFRFNFFYITPDPKINMEIFLYTAHSVPMKTETLILMYDQSWATLWSLETLIFLSNNPYICYPFLF